LTRTITSLFLECTNPIRGRMGVTIPDNTRDKRRSQPYPMGPWHCAPQGQGALGKAVCPAARNEDEAGGKPFRNVSDGVEIPVITRREEAQNGRETTEEISGRTVPHRASGRGRTDACECPAERAERLRRSASGYGSYPPERVRRKRTGYSSYPTRTAEAGWRKGPAAEKPGGKRQGAESARAEARAKRLRRHQEIVPLALRKKRQGLKDPAFLTPDAGLRVTPFAAGRVPHPACPEYPLACRKPVPRRFSR